MRRTGIALLNEGEGRELLKKRCREAGISVTTIEDLIRIELQNVGRGRRAGIFERIDEVLEQEAGFSSEPSVPEQRSMFDVYPNHSAP